MGEQQSATAIRVQLLAGGGEPGPLNSSRESDSTGGRQQGAFSNEPDLEDRPDVCPAGMEGVCNDCVCCCMGPALLGLVFSTYVPINCDCVHQMHPSVPVVITIAGLVLLSSLLGSCWFGRRCCGWQPYNRYEDC